MTQRLTIEKVENGWLLSDSILVEARTGHRIGHNWVATELSEVVTIVENYFHEATIKETTDTPDKSFDYDNYDSAENSFTKDC